MEKIVLTPAEIEIKRVEIEERLKTPVKAFAFLVSEGDQVIGFTKDAQRITKMRAFDRMMMSLTDACGILFDAMILKEESDSRLTDLKPENDRIYLSGLLEVQSVLLPFSNTLKKN